MNVGQRLESEKIFTWLVTTLTLAFDMLTFRLTLVLSQGWLSSRKLDTLAYISVEFEYFETLLTFMIPTR